MLVKEATDVNYTTERSLGVIADLYWLFFQGETKREDGLP